MQPFLTKVTHSNYNKNNSGDEYNGNRGVSLGAVSDDLNSRQPPKEVEVRGPNPLQTIDWIAFKEYLLKTCNSKNTVKVRMCYAKKYYRVLLANDAKDLLTIGSEQKRLNAMKSITLLSRYLGCYDRWQDIRRRYNMKWTAGNESLHAMQRFFNPDLSLDVMLSWIREVIRLLLPLWVKSSSLGVLLD